jgi:hypothetical protein
MHAQPVVWRGHLYLAGFEATSVEKVTDSTSVSSRHLFDTLKNRVVTSGVIFGLL